MADNAPKESRFKNLTGGSEFQQKLCRMIQDAAMFADLEWEQVEQLAGYMKLYQVEPNTVIFREGDRGEYLCLVIEGKVAVVKANEQGKYKTMYVVQPGRVVGEMAIVDGGPRSATCVAQDTSVLAILGRHAFGALVEAHPRLAVGVLQPLAVMLSQRLRRTSGLLVDHIDA